MARKATEIIGNRTLMLQVWGQPKTGKSSFLLGREPQPGEGAESRLRPWPTPIHLLNFDWGTDEMLPMCNPAVLEHVTLHDIRADAPELTPRVAEQQLWAAYKAAREAIEDITRTGGGTVAIDTSTQLWQVIQTVDLEAIKRIREQQGKPLFPYDYGDANARYFHLLQYLKNRGANVILMAHANQEYDDRGNPTGRWYPQANKQNRQTVSGEVMFERLEERLGTAKAPTQKYVATVTFMRPNQRIAGLKMQNLDYPKLYKMVYGTDPENYPW